MIPIQYNHIFHNSFSLRKIFFLISFLFISFTGTHSQNQKFDSIANLIDENSFSHLTLSRNLIDTLYQIARNSPDSINLISECLYREAKVSCEHECSDSTLRPRILKQLTPADGRRLPAEEKALLMYSLGLHDFGSENYSEGFDVLMEGLNLFRAMGNTDFIARTLRLLSHICGNIYLFDISKTYILQAMDIITPEHPEYYGMKQNLFRIYLYNGDMGDDMADSLEILINDLKKREGSNPALLAATYINLQAQYTQLNKVEEVERVFPIIEDLISEIDNPKIDAVYYLNLGAHISEKNQDYEKGLEYIVRAKDLMEENGNRVNLSILYEAMSNIYEKLGNSDSALFYLRKYQALSKKLIPDLKAIETNQRYILTFLETSENKLIIAEQEIALKNKQFIVIVVISVSIILLVLLLLLIIQLKKRKKEIENRELAARLEHDQKIQQIERERQEEMLEAKTREITSYSLLLSNKNNILQQILELNTQLRNNPKDVDNIAFKIDEIIHSNFNVDEEWEDFKMHFDKVHPKFFEKLKNLCGDLTEDNLRMCAYFKIGMSTKQIAQLLHIVPGSVITNRSRLKKKLGLKEERDLDDFIRSL